MFQRTIERIALSRGRRKWKDKDEPLISIYIPTFNRAEMLVERGLSSVCKQTYRNVEVIIADDHLFSRRRPKDPKKNWLLGPTYAANAALAKCRGDWIARNDDDDEWTEEHLEKLLNYARKNDYEFVYGASEQWIGGKPVKKLFQRGTPWPVGSIQCSMYRGYLRGFKFNPRCYRKHWNANNDLDLPLRMHEAGVRFGFLNEVVTIIKPRPGLNNIGLKACLEENPS